MNKPFRKLIATVIIITLSALCIAPSFAADNTLVSDELKGENIVVDFLLVRPVGIAGSLILTSVFILSLPFSALGGNTAAVFDKLVSEPARYTFLRPLGDFSR